MTAAVAVVGALAAAFFNALAGYLQFGAAKRVPGRGALNLATLGALVRERRWLLGAGCDLAAFGCQVTALAFGTLIFVQPILASSLLMVVAIRAARRHVAPKAATAAAAVATCVGLAGFLLAAQPRPGASTPRSEAPPLPLAVGLAAVFLGCLLAATLTRQNRRAVALAVAAGLTYGVTAGLAKIVTGQLGTGWTEPLHHWMLPALVVIGILGAQLTQAAFQAGALAAPVAVLMAVDPLTSILVGLVWLHEQVNTTPAMLVLQGLALACLLAGLTVLAREHPSVSREPERPQLRARFPLGEAVRERRPHPRPARLTAGTDRAGG